MVISEHSQSQITGPGAPKNVQTRLIRRGQSVAKLAETALDAQLTQPE
jgi:hypothetical protein